MRIFFIFLLCMITFSDLKAEVTLNQALTSVKNGDFSRALSELNFLSQQGILGADYYLGKMYYEGKGVPRSLNKAYELFLSSYKQGYALSGYYLYKIPLEIQKDSFSLQGLEFLKEAGRAGSFEALEELGDLYMKENALVQKNHTYAFGFYLLGALKGDKKSQRKLAILYKNGVGTTQDLENAMKWMKRSAHQGYVLAQKDLAQWYEEPGMLNNLLYAYAWYSIISGYNTDAIGEQARLKRAEIEKKIKADGNLISIQREVRKWYPKTPEASVPIEEKIVTLVPIIPGFNDELSLKKVLNSKGVVFNDGIKYNIYPEDISEAKETKKYDRIIKNIEDYAEYGDAAAYGYLGDLMSKTFKEDKLAAEFYKKGAELGNTYAQYQYGRALCSGTGIEAPDIPSCYAWLTYAYENSTSLYRDILEEAITFVQNKITPEEQVLSKQILEDLEHTIVSSDKKSKRRSGNFSFF